MNEGWVVTDPTLAVRNAVLRCWYIIIIINFWGYKYLNSMCTHQELHSQHIGCCLAVEPNPAGVCYFAPDWPLVKVVRFCQTDTWVSRKVLQGIKSILIPQSEWQKVPQQVENIISSDWLGGSAFPLTSTASWSLLFCTQTQRSRNNRERKWKNVTLQQCGWNAASVWYACMYRLSGSVNENKTLPYNKSCAIYIFHDVSWN